MNEIFLTGIIGAITTVISGWTSWIFAKKKYDSEVNHNLIENMENALEFYEKLSSDNRSRLDELTERNKALELELQDLRKQVLNLTMNICLDLTCERRIRENQTKNGKAKDRLDETKDSGRGKLKSTESK
jgi:regulator of replication initiation timing